MKQADFAIWFTQQYGKEPDYKLRRDLLETEADLETKLLEVRRKIRREEMLADAWTAALYARQAFGRGARGRR